MTRAPFSCYHLSERTDKAIMTESHDHLNETGVVEDDCEICASDWYKNMDRSWMRPLTTQEKAEHAQFIWDSSTPERRIKDHLIEPDVRVPYILDMDPEKKVHVGASAVAGVRKMLWDSSSSEEREELGFVDPAEWDSFQK
jgi:hypothetical protein